MNNTGALCFMRTVVLWEITSLAFKEPKSCQNSEPISVENQEKQILIVKRAACILFEFCNIRMAEYLSSC
jgi:hypothetical protein